MVPEATGRGGKNNQTVTHEFVNSLTSVRALAELLAEYPAIDAEYRSQFIGIIREETNRLLRLVNHMKTPVDGLPPT